MKNFTLFALIAMFTGCTYSINMVHTEGTASDVVDEQQTPSTTVSPDINIPISATPKLP